MQAVWLSTSRPCLIQPWTSPRSWFRTCIMSSLPISWLAQLRKSTPTRKEGGSPANQALNKCSESTLIWWRGRRLLNPLLCNDISRFRARITCLWKNSTTGDATVPIARGRQHSHSESMNSRSVIITVWFQSEFNPCQTHFSCAISFNWLIFLKMVEPNLTT